jgi:hypothetical protein
MYTLCREEEVPLIQLESKRRTEKKRQFVMSLYTFVAGNGKNQPIKRMEQLCVRVSQWHTTNRPFRAHVCEWAFLDVLA